MEHLAIEFLLRLLDHASLGVVDHDDLHGRFAALLTACQAAGFLALRPARHPAPVCPHCGEGLDDDGATCPGCFSAVDPRRRLAWAVSLPGFLRWLAAQLHLTGDTRPAGEGLWLLGSHETADGPCVCFYGSGPALSGEGREALAAYRSAVLLYGLRPPGGVAACPVPAVPLASVLGLGESLRAEAAWHSRGGRAVRFDPATGLLQAGGAPRGRVPPGSRECAFLACLALRQGRFVGYAEIKHAVLRATGGRDARAPAAFCHRLKSRLKKRRAPRIDGLVRPGGRGEGYRLLKQEEVRGE